MNVTTLNTAERIAAAVCWLARQPAKGADSKPLPGFLGLPNVPGLRFEVQDRHGVTCDWCDYPLAKLIELCDLDGSPDIKIFERFPQATQRKLVLKALHA